MLKLKNVRKSYKLNGAPRVILDNVNIEVQKGQRWGILGRNGAGKSTLVRVMSGAEDLDGGRIERSMSVSWPLAFGGGFQGGLTGSDNARFIARLYGRPEDEILERVQQFAEIGSYFNEPVKCYSSGMRARLAMGLSLSIDFDCLLIDEILSVGDYHFRAKCHQELIERRKDTAWVLVTHDPAMLAEYCSHYAILDKGKLFTTDSIEEAQERYARVSGIS